MARLSAGAGYRYLLRHTAAGDAARSGSTPLSEYYAATGYPPGRWLGSGIAGLAAGEGLPVGTVVTEDALAALYAGRDPVTLEPLGRVATYREARSWLTEVRSQLGSAAFVRPQRVTLGQWIEEWLPVLESQVRPQTFASYSRNLRLHVVPTLGAKHLQSLKPADLTRLYARLLKSGRADHRAGTGLSHRSVAYVATIIGKCLGAAVRGELLISNPARRAEVPRAGSDGRQHENMRTWSSEDIARFLDLTRTHRFNAVWLVLATTGVRRGEALGLSWTSLDLDASRMSITRTLVDLDGDAPVWSDPKTARGRRSIALDPGTVAVLRSVRAAQAQERLLLGAEYVDHDLVFAHPDGRPLHRERFSRTFGEQVVRHGLPPLSVHGLRHSWATLALQAGVHPKVVQERLGHSTIGITLDVYSHVLPSMETDAAERVAALILDGSA